MNIETDISEKSVRIALKVMGVNTFHRFFTKRTVAFPERITAVESYAMSKVMHREHLRSMGEVSRLTRLGKYNIRSVVDHFDRRDWEAIARGDTKYTPCAS